MYNRISIIGGAGTGKTTLSNLLSEKYNIPVTHLDGIHHLKNWQVRDKAERDKIILDIIEKEKWIIDGTYKDTIKQRVEKADLVIWLDYSSFAQLKGVLKRFFKNPGKEKPEIPGCNERLNIEFLKYVINYRKKKRHFVVEAIENVDQSKVLVFTKQKDLNKWLKKQDINIKEKLKV